MASASGMWLTRPPFAGGCPAAAPDLATPARRHAAAPAAAPALGSRLLRLLLRPPDLRLDTLPAPAQLRVCAFLGPGAVPPAASPLWRCFRREAEAAELEALPLPPRRAPWAAELQPASGRAFLALLLPFGLREAERSQSICRVQERDWAYWRSQGWFYDQSRRNPWTGGLGRWVYQGPWPDPPSTEREEDRIRFPYRVGPGIWVGRDGREYHSELDAQALRSPRDAGYGPPPHWGERVGGRSGTSSGSPHWGRDRGD